MIWYVIIGFFAAVGCLFLLWLLYGACLPKTRAEAVAVLCQPGRERQLLRRYRWMRDLGLTNSSVVLVGSALSSREQSEMIQNFPGVTFLTPEQWLEETKERLEANG